MGAPGTGTGGFGGSGPSQAPRIAPPTPIAGSNVGTGTGGFNTGGPTQAPRIGTQAPSSGGGGLFHSITHGIVGAAHYVSSQGVKAAQLGKQIGTGMYDIGKAVVNGKSERPGVSTGQQWLDFFEHPIRSFQETQHAKGGSGPAVTGAISGLTKGQYEFGKTALEHPGRNIAADVLTLMPLAHGVVKTGLVATGKAGLLEAPRMVSEPGREPVSLAVSKNAARRVVQAGIDKMVNHALANETAKGILGHEGPVAKFGRSRMGGTLAEVARARARLRQSIIARTRGAQQAVASYARSVKADVTDPHLVTQAVLHSLQDNALPADQRDFHLHQAELGNNPEANRAWAQAFDQADRLGVLHIDPTTKTVALNPEHPLSGTLSKADAALQRVGAYGESELVNRGLKDSADLESRKALVNKLIQRGNPLRQPEPQALREARRALEKAQNVHAANLEKEARFRQGNGQKSFEGQRVPTSPNPEGLTKTENGKQVPLENSNPYRNATVLSGQKLEEAQARVQQLEDKHGFSSPERRAAIVSGAQARDEMHAALVQHFGPEEAAKQMGQVDTLARQYARANDVTPQEFYAAVLRETKSVPTIDQLPEDIAPLYEAAPPLEQPSMPQVNSAHIATRILNRADVVPPRGTDPAALHQQIVDAVDKVMPLVEQGAPYRDWYARGAAVLKDAAKRLGVKVKNLLGLVAVTSQGANPTFNLRLAVKAVRELEERGKVTGEPLPSMVEKQKELLQSLGKKPKGNEKGYSQYLFKHHEAQDALEGNPPDTAKRSSYYGNFLHEIDPKAFAKEFGARLDPVTVDRHIAQMLFGTDSPSKWEYTLGEAIFQEIAKELGWKAKEVQAAAWVPWKAMNERQATEISALSREMKAKGEIPAELLAKGDKVARQRADFINQHFAAGRRAENFTPNPLEKFIPNAADAYEAGHAENLGILYDQNGHVIRGAYSPEERSMTLSQHATPETVTHEAAHALRQSLPPVLEAKATRMYAPNGWDRAAEERFAQDMTAASQGHAPSLEVERLWNQTQHFLPGRGYVPSSIFEKSRQPTSPLVGSHGPVMGEPRNPMEKRFASGEAIASGARRTDVLESVAAHWQRMFRYFNTLDHRDLVAQHGSDTRLSSHDILVRDLGSEEPAAKISDTVKEALGQLENQTRFGHAEDEEGVIAGVNSALRDLAGHLYPRLGNDAALKSLEQNAVRGTPAPAGYKWVPEQVARTAELEQSLSSGPRMLPARIMDNVNGAITAATVYYKIGHVTTRTFTNLATNIMQGSARPAEIGRSVEAWRGLTPAERDEALAYAGTHYYEAAPGAEGTSFVGRGMQKGLHVPFTDRALRTQGGEAVMSPQWWAHVIDAPFRFNSLAFEARRAGYGNGAEGIRAFLADVRNYNALDTAKRAEVDTVLRRADREAIAYDRLNPFEKKVLTRAVWFYPWVKGSTVFSANAVLEHPVKSFALASQSQQAVDEFRREFGDMPSYALGLTALTSDKALPVVTDLNTFNPASTASDLLMIPAHMGNLGGMLNPALGAAAENAFGIDQYGAHTPHPLGAALSGLISPAPETQIVKSALDNADQSHRLYPKRSNTDPFSKGLTGEMLRALLGPAAPRVVNPEAGHSLAKRERTGK